MLVLNRAIVFGIYQVEYTLILNLLKGLYVNYKWWLRCHFEGLTLQIRTRHPLIRLYANFSNFSCIISLKNYQLACFFLVTLYFFYKSSFMELYSLTRLFVLANFLNENKKLKKHLSRTVLPQFYKITFPERLLLFVY